MNETLVYDAARDAAHSLFTLGTFATACIVGGFVLMAVPTVLMVRRQPDRRVRGLVGLALIGVIAVAVLFGLPLMNRPTAEADAQTIEGVIGAVSPTLFTVGGMKVMVSCADPARCPGLRTGDRARVAYVEDSGPETDALAVRIWTRPR